MENYTIDKAHAVLASIDSMGSQVKFYKDGYWFKYDCLGVEGLAEEITSILLSCSNITDYVSYEQCMINGKRGCKSADFLDRGEQFISFQALYKNAAGKELAEAVRGLQPADARVQMLLDFIRETTK